MDDNLYDEFGNYIGPDIESDQGSDSEGKEDEDLRDRHAEEEGEQSDGEAPPGVSNGWITAANDFDMDNQIVLAEDKKYYPTAEVYGDDVETLVMDEDELPLEQPIIKPVRNIKFGLQCCTRWTLATWEDGFMDMLVEQTHHMKMFDENSEKHMRYTDTRIDEQERRISIKAIPMSLVLEDSSLKSYLCNIMDTPGHVNFSDEMTAALRLADGAVLIVDAAKGVMVNTERAICHAIQERIPIVVVINKVDRLITELKLPPKDAYHKLRHTLEVINSHISAASKTAGNVPVIDPAAGNVFLLVEVQDGPSLCSHLQNFMSNSMEFHLMLRSLHHVFGVIFIIILIQGLLKERRVYSSRVVTLNNAAYKLNIRPLLRLACSTVFGSASGFTDMLVQHTPSPKDAAAKKVDHTYTGPKHSTIYKAMVECDPSGPLIVNVTKLYPKSNCSVFDAFGRVYSRRIQTGQTLRVLGEGYSPDDEEDMAIKEVTKLWIYQAQYRILISGASPGSWVLIEGTGELYLDSIMKDLRELYFEVEVKVLANWSGPFQRYLSLPNLLQLFGWQILLFHSAKQWKDIENGVVSVDWSRKQLGDFFKTKYDWDLLAARSIKAFGPDKQGPNILLDDTLPTEADKALLGSTHLDFETDLRYHTQGQAFCHSVFDHWAIVPGDPLDKSIVLWPLEPAPIQHLAREFMMKTRRRKGMSEDVSINKFFDEAMVVELAQQAADLHQQMI
ncbi:glycerol-3-phosphate transporter family protein [Hibiscus syriacus]|uniref:Glycerol-3-phosphate transporter family protein n=1 Tax=Hibiscus syriacus TaxID=106335 RepID=A0A6A3BTN8_HIBSY|nr:glycerol-3-phosphate transporter family protein [Hibiscus syriacus]